MSRKIDRALYGPSWVEVILGAALSFLLGIVIGAAVLVFKPITVVRQMPKEEAIDPKAVYYIEGTRETAKARNAAAKRQAFTAGQSVTVTEDEINSLIPQSPAAPPAGESAPAASTDSNDTFATGTPNIRLRDGTMQVGMPVTLNLLGLSKKFTVHAVGGFVDQGDVFVFEPETFYFGSLPLQRLPIVSGLARDKFLDPERVPEDIRAAWPKLADVSVEGNALNLTMP